MSPRAAWRLESLGFRPVYRYAGSIDDWTANGLPVWEGAHEQTVGDLTRRDVPTCPPRERVAVARSRAAAGGWSDCVVVNDARVVLGILRKRALEGDPDAIAEDVMEPGPVTSRLDDSAEGTARYLKERKVTRRLVTTSDGELVGMFFVADVLGAEFAEGELGDREARRREREARRRER